MRFGENPTMTDRLEPLSPPERLLCGPGPSNVHPRVLDAMRHPMLGHLDPEFHRILDRLVDMLERVYRRSDGLTLALSAGGTSGMEAGIAALAEPGDTVVVGACGFFGNRMVEMARRQGLNVVELRAPYGQAVPNEQILGEVRRHPETRLVCVVHAETSTGVAHPLQELASELRDGDAMLLADCVTSLGGMPLEAAGWGVDYCYSCSQKCLGAPPGMSPVTISPRAMERIRSRRTPLPFSFDFLALERYWIDRPATYHHTTPNVQYYALYEGLRLALEEGLESRWQRHAEAGAHLQNGLRERGYELLAEPGVQLAQLSAVRVPEGVDGKEVQRRLLDEHNIEIGGGLGPDAPPIWRIGMMGTNAHRETADRVLDALDAVLTAPRASVSARSA
jgi:alanine-glyoxylate transaminase / serine-glyoxylate transaminase / serine-pyruvate transaminase